jgi:hypothetical protein
MVPKFTHNLQKIKKIGSTPMYGGGNPLYNVLWEIPCNAQHKNDTKIIKKEINKFVVSGAMKSMISENNVIKI